MRPPGNEYTFKKWFPQTHTPGVDSPMLRIVCFHGAGADPFLFAGRRHEFTNPLLDFCETNNTELLCAHLPGRTTRSRDTPATSLEFCATEILSALSWKHDRCPIPWVAVGHSMGCWLLYELCRQAINSTLPPPTFAVLACLMAPTIPFDDRPWRRVKNLSDADLRAEMVDGWKATALENDGLWEMYRVTCRSDMQMVDNYIINLSPETQGSAATISTTSTTAGNSTGHDPIPRGGFPPQERVLLITAENDSYVPATLVRSSWEELLGEGDIQWRQMDDCPHTFTLDRVKRTQFLKEVVSVADRVMLEIEYGGC